MSFQPRGKGPKSPQRPASNPSSKKVVAPTQKATSKPATASRQRPVQSTTQQPTTTTKASPTSKLPSTRKSSPTPEASQARFQNVKVPYIDTEFNLCEIYIDCQEKDDASQLVGRDTSAEPKDSTLDQHSLFKRARKFPVKFSGSEIQLPSLDYPSSSELYKSPRQENPRHVLNFKNNRLGSIQVADTTAARGTVDYVTEHIIEVPRHPATRDETLTHSIYYSYKPLECLSSML
jgi:hypothetical protein